MFNKALLVGTLLVGAAHALVNCGTDISVSIAPRAGVVSWTEDLLTKTLLDIDINVNTCSLVDLKLALNVPVGCIISSSWNLQLDGLLATVSQNVNNPGLILACPNAGTPTVSVSVSLAQCTAACGGKTKATPAPTQPAPTQPAPTQPAATKAPKATKAPATPKPTKAPATPAPTKASKKMNEEADFDDITTSPAAGLTPVPTPYNELAFPGFSVLQTVDLGVTPGIYPESGDQYAISEIRTTLTQGQASMTSVYDGSNVKNFQLNSFYFGCALITGNGATSTPQQCDLFISGYTSENSNTAAVVHQETFVPPSILASTGLQLATLPNSFSGLKTVKFTYVFPAGLNVADGLLGLAIDTVKYSVILN